MYPYILMITALIPLAQISYIMILRTTPIASPIQPIPVLAFRARHSSTIERVLEWDKLKQLRNQIIQYLPNTVVPISFFRA